MFWLRDFQRKSQWYVYPWQLQKMRTRTRIFLDSLSLPGLELCEFVSLVCTMAHPCLSQVPAFPGEKNFRELGN